MGLLYGYSKAQGTLKQDTLKRSTCSLPVILPAVPPSCSHTLPVQLPFLKTQQ